MGRGGVGGGGGGGVAWCGIAPHVVLLQPLPLLVPLPDPQWGETAFAPCLRWYIVPSRMVGSASASGTITDHQKV